MNGRIDPSDYLLGELSETERAAAERRLREEPGFREQVERLRPVVDELRELPREAWELRDPEPAAATPTRSRPRLRLPRLRPAVALGSLCALLLAAGIGIGALIFGGDDGASSTAATIALRPVTSKASRASGIALLDESDNRATVRVSGLTPNAPTSYYELWLMDGPKRLLSLGSFRVPSSGATSVSVPLPVDPRLFHYLDVSLEPVNGGPQHSGDSVLRATT